MIFSSAGQPIMLFMLIPTLFIALPVHEYFHALAATRCGDPTPRALGRLTLNPLRHLDPVGAVALLLFGFGWAKPVPVNSRYFRNPKRSMALVAAAGPLSNLAMSLLGALLYLAASRVFNVSVSLGLSRLLSSFFYYLALFLYVFHLVNLSLCLFNLIPISPLDGSHILALLLPRRACEWIARHERSLYIGLMLWLLCGSFAYTALMRIPFIYESTVLSAIIRVLSVSGLISSLTSRLSALLLHLFSLIPFL